MGLLSIIRKIKRKEKEMHILLVWLDNSGKTTIMLKINAEDTSVISPTLRVNIKTIKYHRLLLDSKLVVLYASSNRPSRYVFGPVLNLEAMDRIWHWQIIGPVWHGCSFSEKLLLTGL